MSLLSPIALAWLGSIPVLLWLWRISSTRRRTHIPSLVPFAHLAKRLPRRRTRLLVNVLFWLQLAAFILLAAALARPVLFSAPKKTVLVIVDTSASMAGKLRGQSYFDRAIRKLRVKLSRKGIREEWLLVTTAPISAVTHKPTGDSTQIRQAIDSLQVNHLAGNLATATHIGTALLDGDVDELVIVTDEPRPERLAAENIEFVTVGEKLANAAIVGLDAQGPLCRESPARLIVTLENFSDKDMKVELAARQGRRILDKTDTSLKSHVRENFALSIPEGTEGWVRVDLSARGDSLKTDNHAQALIRAGSALPIALVSESAEFREIIGGWLDACEGLKWTDGPPDDPTEQYLIVTDLPDEVTQKAGYENLASPNAVGSLRWLSPGVSARVVLAHWMVTGTHPIGSYLSGLEPVAASLGSASDYALGGEPIVWGLLDGQKLPIVLAGRYEGRRTVSFFVDPSSSPESRTLILLFFNSVRWLMGQAEVIRTGEPVVISALEAGLVTVRRPDGSLERAMHAGGTFQYAGTTLAGTYRIVRGTTVVSRAANFLDPLESNLFAPTSTWQPVTEEEPTQPKERRIPRPLARILILAVLVLLLVEWWLYCTGKR